MKIHLKKNMISADIREKVKLAGLTDNEAKVYLCLLEEGARTAGIISRKIGLHRRVIYDVTERLIKKGLIGYIVENNKRMFHASNPQRLMEIIEEERGLIGEAVPLLLDFYHQAKYKEKDETIFFKGKSGLKSVFEDQLEELGRLKQRKGEALGKREVALSKELLIISPISTPYEIFPFYFGWYDKKRKEKNIKAKVIFYKDFEIEKIPKIPLSEIRFLSEKYASPMAINIYGDKVAIIMWSKENPIAIVIKQKEIADGYRKHFELMWKNSKI
mgnify:CR=1 FL=1